MGISLASLPHFVGSRFFRAVRLHAHISGTYVVCFGSRALITIGRLVVLTRNVMHILGSWVNLLSPSDLLMSYQLVEDPIYSSRVSNQVIWG
jgi:hypothetical protein